jgi:hypothetical protein
MAAVIAVSYKRSVNPLVGGLIRSWLRELPLMTSNTHVLTLTEPLITCRTLPIMLRTLCVLGPALWLELVLMYVFTLFTNMSDNLIAPYRVF